MTDAIPIVVTSWTGSVFGVGVRTATVFNGARGPQGRPGDEGPAGPSGLGVNVLGDWMSGANYGPNDAVFYTSSVMEGVTNLYIQRTDVAASVSTTPPSQDGARWVETGFTDFGDAFGNVWQVTQPGHGFTVVGTTVSWDEAFNVYIKANSTPASDLPVAVIREIPDANTFILQSSGLLPVIDAAVVDGGGGLVDGAVYYQRLNGLVSSTPPGSGFVVPIFKVVGAGGIVFPYQNAGTIPAPVPAPVPATTQIKVDDISAAFDNVETDFPVTVAAAPVVLTPAESFDVYIDGHRQEPLVDYVIADSGGNSVMSFSTPPQDYQRFWASYASG